jgi:uncharacterized RDD family membrane protein YckC
METILTIQSVTGVDLQLRIAGPGGRSYAFIIDWHIRFLAALLWLVLGMFIYFGGMAAAGLVDEPPAGYVFGVLVPAAVIYYLYHPILEVLMRGRTPGKRIAGVRLVKRDGGIPGPGALLIRNAFRLIDSLPFMYLVGLTATLLTKHSVRIGDIAAGTLLVYDEAPPQDVLGDLSRASIARFGLGNAELVRDLLARWDEIEPRTRAELARRLLDKLGRAGHASQVGAGDGGRAELERLLAE